MSSFHIVTDSVSQIPEALRQELDIHVVPLPYIWDGESFLDYDISPREFFARLRSSKSIPKTSGPTPGSFKDVYERLGADGKPILTITVGEVFSSTYSAAKLASEMVEDIDVRVVSSDSNSMGFGFQVLAAARAARAGASREEVLDLLKKTRERAGVVFAITNTKYLLTGGRISQFAHFFASTLELFPVMEICASPIQPLERVRTKRRVIPHLLQLLEERLSERPWRIAVVHTDAEAWAWEMAKEARQRFQPDEIIISELTPVLGIHIGPDSLGLAYLSGV
ncbi:MAG: DegV family protein [Anaerolineales bacterium]|jgi:DegV family protein with EDD domain